MNTHESKLKIVSNNITSDGLRLLSQPDCGDIEFADGPKQDMFGAKSNSGENLKYLLERPVSSKGALLLWFKTDKRYDNGINADRISQKLLSVENMFSVTLESDIKSFNVKFQWDSDNVKGVDPLNVLLPGFPGPGWFSLFYRWDSDKGIFNGYLNGTRLRQEGTVVKSWKLSSYDKLSVFIGQFAISDVTFFQEPITIEQLDISSKDHNSVGSLLGYTGKEDDINFKKGELIYQNSFGSDGDIKDWVLEGKADAAIENEGVVIKTTSPDSEQGHSAFWCPEDMPASFIAQWEAQVLSDNGLLIVFLSGAGEDGRDLFDKSLEKRTGDFFDYINGDINCYHISYYANTPFNPGRITSNFRKNKGFYLLANGPIVISPGSKDVHKVELVKNKGKIKLSVNGKTAICYEDKGDRYGPVLREGKIGLRQMRSTIVKYKSFKVFNLIED